MQSLISAQSVTLFMFIYCYCGNSITVNCEKITDAALQSCWYEYPIEYQQFMRHIIRRSQKAFHLTAFGIVECSFETFKKVRFYMSTLIIWKKEKKKAIRVCRNMVYSTIPTATQSHCIDIHVVTSCGQKLNA